jgi:hypothetical protein
MNTVCPVCGVAVVPGYIKCPRCHAGLPAGLGRTKRTTVDPGGTAVPQRGFPLSVVLVGVGIAMAIIIVLAMRGGGKKIEAAPPAPPEPMPAIIANPQPRAPTVTTPSAVPAASSTPQAAVQDPGPAVAELKAALRAQRLWGSVDLVGQRVEVRSGSCADPGMRSLIEAKKSLLHGAGLTNLRCVEQSGAVVFERDL